MFRSKQKKKTADEIIHNAIMAEGKALEQMLGPVTYQDPPDFNSDETFQRLLEDRKELHRKKK